MTTSEMVTTTTPLFDFEHYVAIFIESLTTELSTRISESEEVDVVRFLIQATKSYKLHSLLTTQGVELVSATVFQNEAVRDFTLCLCDRFFLSIEFDNNSGLPERIRLQQMIIKALSYQAQPTESVFNGETPAINYSSFMNTDKESITQLLAKNQWLIVIIMIVMIADEILEIAKK